MNDQTEESNRRAQRQRNYQACLGCKKQKIRCQLGSPINPKPPCIRCQRLMQQCVFGPPRRGKTDTTGDQSISHISPVLDGAQSSTQSTPPAAPVATTPSQVASNVQSHWSTFRPCQSGLLTYQQADLLLSFFFNYIHPHWPLVSEEWTYPQRQQHFHTQEPLLCTTVLSVAARYAWSTNQISRGESLDISKRLLRAAQTIIQDFVFGLETQESQKRIPFGVIESLLFLIQWSRTSNGIGKEPATSIKRPMTADPAACTVFGKVSDGADAGAVYELITQQGRSGWRLMQIALTLAEEWQLIPINQEKVELPPIDPTDERRRRRLLYFFWPKVFEVSMESQRIGLQYYDISSAEKPGPPDLAYSNFMLLRSHKVLNSSLKSSPELTNHFLASGAYIQLISTAKDIGSQWYNDYQAQHCQSTASPFKVYTDMHYHFIQALPGMVALHALTRRLTTVTESGSTDTTEGYLKYLDLISLEQSQRDLQYIAEVPQAVGKMMELTLGLHDCGQLRYLPKDACLRLVVSIVFCLRTVGLTSIPTATLALMKTVVLTMGEMDVDPSNIMTAFASLLLPLVEKAEAYNKSQNQTLANSMTMQLQQSQSQPQSGSNGGAAAASADESNTAHLLPVLPDHRRPQTSIATSYCPMNGAPANYGANNNWMEHWDKWLDFQNDGSFPIDAPDYFFF